MGQAEAAEGGADRWCNKANLLWSSEGWGERQKKRKRHRKSRGRDGAASDSTKRRRDSADAVLGVVRERCRVLDVEPCREAAREGIDGSDSAYSAKQNGVPTRFQYSAWRVATEGLAVVRSEFPGQQASVKPDVAAG